MQSVLASPFLTPIATVPYGTAVLVIISTGSCTPLTYQLASMKTSEVRSPVKNSEKDVEDCEKPIVPLLRSTSRAETEPATTLLRPADFNLARLTMDLERPMTAVGRAAAAAQPPSFSCLLPSDELCITQEPTHSCCA